jgi:multidrug efflux pump subunit AcrA (membrane-fusion protein)
MLEQDASRSQLEGLATLLILGDEIRKLPHLREFGFFATNETHRLVSYHTAYLWQFKRSSQTQVIAQSGIPEIDPFCPHSVGLKNQIDKLRVSPEAKKIHQIDLKNSSGPINMPDTTVFQKEELDDLPQYLLWCPFMSKSNQLSGGLILFRETPFSEAEIKMLAWLLSSYQYTWSILIKPPMIPEWKRLKEKPYLLAGGAVVTGILFFPVRLSVIGVGTVIPKTPTLINAPMQGVIQSFAVKPGDTISSGQLLFSLDKTELQATAEVNERDLLLTQAKLRTAIDEGFNNKESRAEVPILQAQLAIDQSHLNYTRTLLKKADVASPTAGIIIFDNTEDWIGQPVQTGERIMVVADPRQVDLKITVPVQNIIKLEKGARGEFFLYGQLTPLPIYLTTLGYNAKVTPSKILSYEFIASFGSGKRTTSPQLGAQGTAKLYGHYVPLAYYLLRRPLQAMRYTLGI